MIPKDAKTFVQEGKDVDFSELNVNDIVPNSKSFRIFKYKNPLTKR